MRHPLSPAIDRVFKGLLQGLSAYFQSQIRIALIWQELKGKPRLVCDPMGLLSDNRDAIRDFYLSKTTDYFQEIPKPGPNSFDDFGFRIEEHSITIGNLLTVAGRSSHIFYQRWFIELPGNACHSGPVYRWVCKAISEGTADVFYPGRAFNLGTQAWLSTFAEAAVHWHILSEQDRNRPKIESTLEQVIEYYLPLQSILKSVGAISTAVEEGKSANGTIAFLPNDEISKLLKTPGYRRIGQALPGEEDKYAPRSLKNTKLARKLLSITDESICLVSNGSTFNALGPIPPVGRELLIANFRMGKASIKYNGTLVCCVSNGQFIGLQPQADLSEVRSALYKKCDSETNVDQLLGAVQSIVDNARSSRHGCTILLDMNNSGASLAGQVITPPIEALQSNLSVLQRMSSVDGAICLNMKGELKQFAILLDGMRSPKEDPARGARYNSVIRFMEKSGKDYIVVVASEDGPVTVFHENLVSSSNREDQEIFELKPVEYSAWMEC